jgi:cell division protein FtsW (lipid II flippase)
MSSEFDFTPPEPPTNMWDFLTSVVEDENGNVGCSVFLICVCIAFCCFVNSCSRTLQNADQVRVENREIEAGK